MLACADSNARTLTLYDPVASAETQLAELHNVAQTLDDGAPVDDERFSDALHWHHQAVPPQKPRQSATNTYSCGV